jgi:methylglutaconyl-CoA hydratase
MNYRFLKVDRRGAVSYATLNRPDLRNAFNADMIAEITDWGAHLQRDRSVRAAVIAGAGTVFCAGADIEWLASTMNFTPAQYGEDARAVQSMLQTLDTLPVPLIGRIQGAAIAGGVGLTAVCDIAIAATDAVFATTEVKIGIVPALISPFVLAKISVSAARWAFLSGARFSSQRALDIGLVHEVVAAADLDATVDRYVTEALAAGPEAIATAKALIRAVAGREPRAVAGTTAQVNTDRRMSAEGLAGMRAFLNKQRPPWTA